MNDDLLETYLREMQPVPLPSALLDRLQTPPEPIADRIVYPAIPWLFFAGPPVALAALLFLVAMLDGLSAPRSSFSSPARVAVQPSPVRPSPPIAAGPGPLDYRIFQPVARHSTLVALSPGIVVSASPDRPLRLMQAKWLDDITYVGTDHSTLRRKTTRTEFVVAAYNSL